MHLRAVTEGYVPEARHQELSASGAAKGSSYGAASTSNCWTAIFLVQASSSVCISAQLSACASSGDRKARASSGHRKACASSLHGAGSADNTRKSIRGIIEQLGGKKKLDIWNPGRRDPNVPLEETFKAAQEFIDSGELTALALSEVNADTLREGAKVTELALCELELSMFTPDILKNGVAATCAELDIPVMAYSPVGRGVSPSSHLLLFRPNRQS